jgi:hypothetical protein
MNRVERATVRRHAAYIATAEKLRTMAGELEDLTKDLQRFPFAATRCASASAQLRQAANNLGVPARQRTTS